MIPNRVQTSASGQAPSVFGHWNVRPRAAHAAWKCDPVPGRVSLSIQVEAADVLKVRRAVIQGGDGDVEIVRCAPVPGTSAVRLSVELESLEIDQTMVRIMRSIEQGQIGRVTMPR